MQVTDTGGYITNMPPELETIILDYYYSLKLWEIKQKLHRELKHLHMLQEMQVFYRVFYTINITYEEEKEATLLLT